MDTSLKIYKRTCEEKISEVGRLSREVIVQKSKYSELERKKLRKVRVGDRFMVPNTEEWKNGFRATECTITELNDTDLVAVNKENSTTRWSVKWNHLQYMIFLSNEPIRPFEFTK